LNEVSYGLGYWGIGPAARGWFDEEPSDLGLAEAALLAGLLASPPRVADDRGRLAEGRRTALVRPDYFFPGKYREAALTASDRSPLPERTLRDIKKPQLLRRKQQ